MINLFGLEFAQSSENGGNIIEFPNSFDGAKQPKSISPVKHKTEPIMPTINNFLFKFINIPNLKYISS